MKKLTIILLAAAAEEISLSSPEFAATLEQQYFFDDYNALSSGDKNSGVYTFESTDIVFKPVTYQELIYLFEQEGNSLILLGGSWCGNTQAAVATINDYAVANDLIVYWYDPAWDSYGSRDAWDYTITTDPRYGVTGFNHRYDYVPFVKGYVDRVTRYLTNLTVADDISADFNGVHYELSFHFDYTDENGDTYSVGSLQVPYLLAYNRDAVDEDGFPAPIFAVSSALPGRMAAMTRYRRCSHERIAGNPMDSVSRAGYRPAGVCLPALP